MISGQFRPINGSQPYIGEQGQLEKVPEWRVEMLVEQTVAAQVRKALLASHPYEEPAFEFLHCAEI